MSGGCLTEPGMLRLVTVLSTPAAERRFRRFRVLGIVFLVVGFVLLLALITTGAWWLGLLLAVAGFGLTMSARSQLARSRYEPFVYDGYLDVVGEANYVKDIDAIYRSIGQDSNTRVTAALLPEPNNPHDPNAVAVGLAVGDRRRIVGYLPRETAAEVRPLVQSYLARNVIPSVTATIEPFVPDDTTTLLYKVRIFTTPEA